MFNKVNYKSNFFVFSLPIILIFIIYILFFNIEKVINTTSPEFINHYSNSSFGPMTINELEISFNFYPKKNDLMYSNLFSTSSSRNSLRIEMQPNHNFVLVAKPINIVNLDDCVSPFFGINNHSHFKMHYEKNKFLLVNINGIRCFYSEDYRITRQSYSANDFKIADFNGRKFNGTIQNLSIMLNHNSFFIFHKLLFLFIVVLTFFIYKKISASRVSNI